MAEKKQTTESIASEQVATPTQQGRPCPKDCRKCSWMQQVCCSSMMSFQMFEVMNGIITRLDLQSQRIFELEQRIPSIQSTDAELVAPEPIHGNLFDNQD